MKTRLLRLWEVLTTNYWLIPTLMLISAGGLAFLTSYWDVQVSQEKVQEWGWVWFGSAEGAREVLSAIAGSMITVAGVTFSITIVALAQASSQFGPMLLRNFMRDRGNQVVLGTFLATFIYCLLILRTVQDGAVGESSVPHLSVTCGIIFAIASLAVLIYFIHHICEELQAENLLARVGRDLESTIRRDFAEDNQEDEEEPDSPPDCPEGLNSEGAQVRSKDSGYIQAIDTDALVQIASEHEMCFALERHGGDFVAEGNLFLRGSPGKELPEGAVEKICKTFILGRHRTPTQDTDYSVHQLVQIAVRALSPGINDSFTAVTCVDWLGSALATMAGRKTPQACLRDEKGEIRVILKPPSFVRMIGAGFNQVRQNAKGNVAVSIRLLETLERIAAQARRPEDLQAISQQAAMIMSDCEHCIENAWDLAAIQETGRRVLALTDGHRRKQRQPAFSDSQRN